MSSEMFRLKSLSIEGFRGVNDRLELDIEALPTLIFGPNGGGKTSILQAIEWGLYGRIPHMRGGEFDIEDAIVNQFHPKEVAQVELVLESPTRTIKVVRKRKKSRWSRRKSSLTLEVDGTPLKGKQAQGKIEELLGLTEDEFYAAIYLHQEAIRDFIIGDLKDRSAMMDRLLGTYSLRELIDSLPITHLKRQANEVQEQIQNLKLTELRKLPEVRSKLEALKKGLLQRGVAEKNLDIRFLSEAFPGLTSKVENLADKIAIPIPHLETPPQNLMQLQRAASRLRDNISRLEREKFKKYRELSDRKATITLLRNQYADLLKRRESQQVKDQETYELSLRGIEKQIAEKSSKRDELRDLRSFLQGENVALKRQIEDLENLREAERELVSEHGDMEGIETHIARLKGEADGLTSRISGLETYSQLIANALEYVRAQKPSVCPICKSSIDPLQIVGQIQEEVSQAKAATQILELKKRLRGLKDEISRLQKTQRELEDLENRVARTRSALEDLKKTIAERTGIVEVGPKAIEDRLSDVNSELKELEASIDQLGRKRRALESGLTSLKEVKENIRTLTQRIHSETEIEEEGKNLLQGLSKALQEAEAAIRAFDTVTSTLDGLMGQVKEFEGILGYLTQEEEVSRLEQEFPELEALMRELDDKHRKLRALETGLADIRQAALAEQRSLVSDMLKEVESDINHYYSQLVGHNYYVDLGLSLETRRNRNIYWIKAKGAEHETHIKTRFSNAQLNATAIAIFASMSKHLPHNLNLAILDDPTQSMDQLHKKALAAMLAEETKEKQVIVATQDREFQEQLVKLIQPNKNIHIVNWDTQGPAIG